MTDFIRWFEEISIQDIPLVGGKTASLGEMYRSLTPQGIRIPSGFAVTADAFLEVMAQDGTDEAIYGLLRGLDTADVGKLANIGQEVRAMVRRAGLPANVAEQIRQAYRKLSSEAGSPNLDVAVRSSATAEDLPNASFAGQQETFLNVQGEDDLLDACLNCFASLFTDRAISYRVSKGFEHAKVRLSICVQRMVRSDLGASGVIFTLDTETGARNVILITSAYGLGENIVGGRVDPDEFLVSKTLLEKAPRPILRRRVGAKQMRLAYSTHGSRRTKNVEVSRSERERLSLSDEDVMILAKWSARIETYYSSLNGHETPMDIEWAKDGQTGELFILQARPETVHAAAKPLEASAYVLNEKSEVLLRGRAVGSKVGAGAVQIVRDVSELGSFQSGEVLVADMTDPDWEPVMKKASAIVTNRGGRTCHAAIVSREHGIPCVVGTGSATEALSDGRQVTVSCAEGDEGLVYEGILSFTEQKTNWQAVDKTRTKIMVNLGNPDQALKVAALPVDGVGLTRIEFIIAESVKVHPMALVHRDRVSADEAKVIESLLANYDGDYERYFVEKLSEGVGLIAAAFYPRPVIVRLSDFKTNEYAGLVGGREFEPQEENPMIGFRGASRYYHPDYADGFALECRALRYVRQDMGLKNVKIMVPFCRTPAEGERVLAQMARHGLASGHDGLEVYVMCELPSNVMAAAEFARVFDGFSIGSNDLTQMVLGVDRDSALVSDLFDEREPAVLRTMASAIEGAHAAGRPIGICGQAPSDYPEVTRFLVEQGIDSISVTPDSVLRTIEAVAEAERGTRSQHPRTRVGDVRTSRKGVRSDTQLRH